MPNPHTETAADRITSGETPGARRPDTRAAYHEPTEAVAREHSARPIPTQCRHSAASDQSHAFGDGLDSGEGVRALAFVISNESDRHIALATARSCASARLARHLGAAGIDPERLTSLVAGALPARTSSASTCCWRGRGRAHRGRADDGQQRPPLIRRSPVRPGTGPDKGLGHRGGAALGRVGGVLLRPNTRADGRREAHARTLGSATRAFRHRGVDRWHAAYCGRHGGARLSR